MTSCPYCDGTLTALGVRLGYGIGRCQTCASLACLDDVGEDVLAALYGDAGYYTGGCAPYGYDGDLERNDVQRTPAWERRLTAITQITDGRRLLELGPGWGGFLRLAHTRGWTVAAVDPYPVRELPGTVFPSMEAIGDAGPFDAICLFDVLEHALEPLRMLEQVRALVAPSGCAAIGLPNVDGPTFRSRGLDWCEVKPPEHVSLPSAMGMRLAAQRTGFTVAAVIGHLGETWLWEPLRGVLDPAWSQGALASASRFGARVLNRGLREVRTRVAVPPPERQDYVTWLLVPAAGDTDSPR